MRVCVFCSANAAIDECFFEQSRQLGRWIAREGHTLVYGGANLGLMECLAQTVIDTGGKTIGVVPTRLEERGRVSQYNSEIVKCNSLNERIQIMLSESDMFVALPGGIGTLDEIFAVAASHTIGYHHKPLILVNVKGFWNSVIALLDDLQRQGMVRSDWHDYIQVITDVSELE